MGPPLLSVPPPLPPPLLMPLMPPLVLLRPEPPVPSLSETTRAQLSPPMRPLRMPPSRPRKPPSMPPSRLMTTRSPRPSLRPESREISMPPPLPRPPKSKESMTREKEPTEDSSRPSPHEQLLIESSMQKSIKLKYYNI